MRTEQELAALKAIPILKKGMWVHYKDPGSTYVLQGIVTSLEDVKVGPDTKVRMRLADQYGDQVVKIGNSEEVVIATLTKKSTKF